MNMIDSVRAQWEERYERLREEAQWCAVEGDEVARARIERELETLWSALHAVADAA